MPCASKNHNFVPDRSVFKIRFKNPISIEYIARRKTKLTPNLGEIKKTNRRINETEKPWAEKLSSLTQHHRGKRFSGPELFIRLEESVSVFFCSPTTPNVGNRMEKLVTPCESWGGNCWWLKSFVFFSFFCRLAPRVLAGKHSSVLVTGEFAKSCFFCSHFLHLITQLRVLNSFRQIE